MAIPTENVNKRKKIKVINEITKLTLEYHRESKEDKVIRLIDKNGDVTQINLSQTSNDDTWTGLNYSDIGSLRRALHPITSIKERGL